MIILNAIRNLRFVEHFKIPHIYLGHVELRFIECPTIRFPSPPLNSGKTAQVASKLFWTLLCCLVRSTKWVNSHSKQTIRNSQPFRVHAIFLFLSPFLLLTFRFFVIFCVREQLVKLVKLGRKGEYWGKQRITSDSRCADEWRARSTR